MGTGGQKKATHPSIPQHDPGLGWWATVDGQHRRHVELDLFLQGGILLLLGADALGHSRHRGYRREHEESQHHLVFFGPNVSIVSRGFPSGESYKSGPVCLDENRMSGRGWGGSRGKSFWSCWHVRRVVGLSLYDFLCIVLSARCLFRHPVFPPVSPALPTQDPFVSLQPLPSIKSPPRAMTSQAVNMTHTCCRPVSVCTRPPLPSTCEYLHCVRADPPLPSPSASSTSSAHHLDGSSSPQAVV